MNAAEMNFEIDLKLKGLPDVAQRMFISLDRNKFLNEAQDEFFIMAYNTFDRTELEKKTLSKLVTSLDIISFSSSSSNFPNGVTANIPDTCKFVIEEYVIFTNPIPRPTGTTANITSADEIVSVKPIKYSYYISNIDNPFNQPYEGLVWRLDFGGNHELITDGKHTIASYTIKYFRQPVAIDLINDIDCEINPLYHRLIVNNAVKKMTDTVTRLLQIEEATKQRQPKEPVQQ